MIDQTAGSAAGASDTARRLGEIRDEARHRLADTVTALENVRLQLHALKQGAVTVEGVTAAVEAAGEIGDAVDRYLAARQEVEQLLRQPPPASDDG